MNRPADNDDLDDQLRELLQVLPTPDHAPGYRERLDEALGGAAGARRPARPWRWWRGFRFGIRAHRLRLALAVAAAAVAATLLALFGLPGTTERTGPQRVDAAQVVRIAQDALSSAHTITADFGYWDGDPGTTPQFNEPYQYHVIFAADGSYRVSQRAPLAYVRRSAGAIFGIAGESAYDAPSGVERGWGCGWEGMTIGQPLPNGGQRVGVFVGETIGIAPGQPDGGESLTVSGFPAYDGLGMELFGAIARVSASTIGTAEVGTFDGRPVWMVSCPVTPEPDDPPDWATPNASGWVSPVNRLTVTVDQLTGLPVRVQEWVHDKLAAEAHLVNVQVDVTVPDDAFTLTLPTAAAVKRSDDGLFYLSIDLGAQAMALPLPNDPTDVSTRVGPIAVITEGTSDNGFRSLSIDRVEQAIGRAPFVAAQMPLGFRLASVAVNHEVEPVQDDDTARAGTGIVCLRYESGFRAIVVSTRKVDASDRSGQSSINVDPFTGGWWTGSIDCRTPVELTGGAFAGAEGMVVIAPLTIPHLWAVKDGFLLTVGGDATAEQLLEIANSIERWEPKAQRGRSQ